MKRSAVYYIVVGRLIGLVLGVVIGIITYCR